MANVTELTKQLVVLAASPPTDLSEAFMGPLDAALRYSFGVYETTAVRLAIDMKLFDTAVPAGGPLTSSELASKAGADVQLVSMLGQRFCYQRLQI
jgi:hypothetical protein